MNTVLFIIILNVVVLAFMGVGFLRGLVGLKYTLFRFILYLLVLGLTFALMGTVTDKILTIKVDGSRTITEILIDLVQSIPFVSNLYNDSARIKEVVDQIPRAILQLLSFSLTFTALHLISNIIVYPLVKNLVLKNIEWFDVGKKEEKHKKEIENKKRELKGQKAKTIVIKQGVSSRSRLYGGLMGAVFGFVTIMTILLPASGVISTVGKVMDSGERVYASEVEEHESLPEQIFGENYITVKSYINAYRNSSIGFIAGIGGMDREFVRNTTTVTIDDKNVNLIDSVEKMGTIYEDVLYMIKFKMEYTDLSSLANMDVSKIKNIVEYMLDNELFDSLLDELLTHGMDYVVTNVQMEGETKEFVEKINTLMLADGSPKNYLKEEILNLLDVAQYVFKSEIVPEFQNLASEEKRMEAINTIVDKLLEKDENEKSYIENIITEFSDSTTLKVTGNFIFNKILGLLENAIIKTSTTPITETKFLGRVDLDYQFNYGEIGEIVDSVGNVYKVYNKAGISKDNMLYDLVTATDDDGHITDKLLTLTGQAVDKVLTLDILNYQVSDTERIIDRLVHYLSDSNMFSIINVEYLTEENIVSKEIQLLKNVTDLFYNSQAYTEVTNESFNKEDMVKILIRFLNENYNGTEIKNSNLVAQNLLSTKLLRNTEENFLVSIFQNIGQVITTYASSSTEIPDVVTTNIHTDEQKELIGTISQDVLGYYVEYILNAEDKVVSILNSDYVALGNMLEEMRTIEMFAGEDGYYNTVMRVLDTKFEKYLNFEVATENDFNMKDEMIAYGEALKEFLNYEVTDNGTEVTMFMVFAGATSLTEEEALTQMFLKGDLVNYYHELKDCRLINPTMVLIFNLFAEHIGV